MNTKYTSWKLLKLVGAAAASMAFSPLEALAQETGTGQGSGEQTTPEPSLNPLDYASDEITLDVELRRQYGIPEPLESERCRLRWDVQCTLDPDDNYNLLCAQEKEDGWYLCGSFECGEEMDGRSQYFGRITDPFIIGELEDDQSRQSRVQSQVGGVREDDGCYSEPAQ